MYTPFKSSVYTNFSPQNITSSAGHSLTAAIVSRSSTSSVNTSPPKNAGPERDSLFRFLRRRRGEPQKSKTDFLALFDTELEKEE